MTEHPGVQLKAADMGVSGYRIWGLGISALHDRFWAAHGIQVVRQGEPVELVETAELYMLLDRRLLTVFRPAAVVESMYWSDALAIFARIHDARTRPYVERVVTSPDGKFDRIVRDYGSGGQRLARVALTTSRDLAAMWQRTGEFRSAWNDLRSRVPRLTRATASVNGTVFDRDDEHQAADFVRQLQAVWTTPSSTIPSLRQLQNSAWAHDTSGIERSVTTIGTVWIGSGRTVPEGTKLVGPAVLWDCARNPSTASDKLDWAAIEPTDWISGSGRMRRKSVSSRLIKRVFDVVMSVIALLLFGWVFPLVMLAIYLEDGRPFYFGHERESIGGRRFKCWKFRSMRKDAEKIKAELAKRNQADGPQFYIENDPRMTRVGAIIRKLNLDELPQFFNVLVGDMSIVGPRPSPFSENQYSPTWREARLSVMPGITGLWQVRRTRKRGTDFQEWIKYDIEYVETATFRLDLKIIWQTIMMIVIPRGKK